MKCFFLLIVITACKTFHPTTLHAQLPQTINESPTVINIPNYPLHDEKDLDLLLKEMGNARIVLLGEASHGTSEFYTWRTAITKRLITEKGFDLIVVEGDCNE